MPEEEDDVRSQTNPRMVGGLYLNEETVTDFTGFVIIGTDGNPLNEFFCPNLIS